MARTPSNMVALGTKAPDFCLIDTEGKTISRSDFDGKPLLVMFICNHCPFVIHIRDGLAAFASEYQEKGLGIVGIMSNDHEKYPDDGPEKMKAERAQAGYVFPYLLDGTQEVARAYRAACTPDFFLHDADHALAYRGQFDGARPGSDVPVDGRDLKAACDAVLAGEAVPSGQMPSIGCNIKWKPGNEPDVG